jgi:hypothetical protein
MPPIGLALIFAPLLRVPPTSLALLSFLFLLIRNAMAGSTSFGYIKRINELKFSQVYTYILDAILPL